jgi:hypothetical protein
MRHTFLAPLLLALLLPVAAFAGAELGKGMPGFDLKSVTGVRVTRENLLGQASVLVVGRTEKAAPLCKEWMLRLLQHYQKKVLVYQVIVVKKPWFIPRSAVLSRIRGFIPAEHIGKVLLEWYTVFADTWGIPMHDEPVVFGMDPKGRIRFLRKGKLEEKPFADLLSALKPHVK